MNKIAIAIDGPAGAGKSTVAKEVARQLNYTYIDTGAMYRAVTWQVISTDSNVNDEKIVCKIAESTKIELAHQDGMSLVYANGVDITNEIRKEAVSESVSVVAAYPCVRIVLVLQQRKMATKGGVVMDGRDIGTVVLPAAELKIFLTASVEIRALRRLEQMQESSENKIKLEEVERNLRKRDLLDSQREMSPLRQADDALLLDNGNLSVQATVEQIIQLAKKVASDVS